jgi:chromate transport protein ChrA
VRSLHAPEVECIGKGKAHRPYEFSVKVGVTTPSSTARAASSSPCLGFGGPVALVGQMERELVDGKKWLSKEQMREAIAICQSLPGPLAIQVGIYVSYLRGGFWGAWAGGWAFILPNFIIVAAPGALYVYLGDLQLMGSVPLLSR